MKKLGSFEALSRWFDVYDLNGVAYAVPASTELVSDGDLVARALATADGRSYSRISRGHDREVKKHLSFFLDMMP